MESNIPQPIIPAAPTAAPGTAAPTDGAAEVYRRAVEAKPTGFTENPISAMASAADRLGGAAARLIKGKAAEGQDGLAEAENRLKVANAAVKANPNSVSAKQEQLKAALLLLRDMQKLSPNDPRRVKVSQFAVRVANSLGKDGLAHLNAQGLDVRGLLRQAAQVAGRFGDAHAMQEAFQAEQLLAGTLPESSVEAIQARQAMMDRLGLSAAARKLLTAGWAVRMARPGEMPSLDAESRMMVINAAQDSPSLGVLARAWWHDQAIDNPADKDGFMKAFLKIANQHGFVVLDRKYKDLRRMARQELNNSRSIATLGSGADAPVFAAANQRGDDESGDMGEGEGAARPGAGSVRNCV